MHKKTILFLAGVLSLIFILDTPSNVLAACLNDSDCNADQLCQIQFGANECAPRPTCNTDIDCSSGKTCQFFSVSRKVCLPPVQGNQSEGGQVSGQSSGCVPGNNGREVCQLTNPIAATEVSDIISTVIKAMLGIIGGLTLLMFVWGGFQWLTSAGSPEKIKSGMQTMIWAVIGVMLVLASYLLLSTFLDFLTGKA